MFSPERANRDSATCKIANSSSSVSCGGCASLETEALVMVVVVLASPRSGDFISAAKKKNKNKERKKKKKDDTCAEIAVLCSL